MVFQIHLAMKFIKLLYRIDLSNGLLITKKKLFFFTKTNRNSVDNYTPNNI